jgi:hypothetical protein
MDESNKNIKSDKSRVKSFFGTYGNVIREITLINLLKSFGKLRI